MARRRYFRPDQNWNRGPRVNEVIRKSPIRLINENNEMIGVVETPEALRMAREAGLDLVEVAPDSDPPVCRILDYGKYRYEQSKKDKANKARSKGSELKEVRLGRSMKIDPHDVQIRLNQARKFLMEGHKVQIVQNFRGREMIHRDKGYDRLRDISEQLADIAKVEMEPRLAGRRLTMLLSPERAKIDQIKRRMEAERQQKSQPEAGKSSSDAPADDTPAAAPSDAAPESAPAADAPVIESTPPVESPTSS